MENKINIAKLLKNCPSGMELDCTIYNNVTLFSADDREDAIFPIVILRSDGCKTVLSEYGQFAYMDDAKCVIFPKGKTTWDGFVPPCKFKDGDVVATNDGCWVGITTGGVPEKPIPTYCVIGHDEFEVYLDKKQAWRFNRLATDEEKQKLFQAIKDNGYHWNVETSTLEKLVEPKFKVGDKVQWKEDIREKRIIDNVINNCYTIQGYGVILFTDQDEWELAPNKFDLTTLKPFDKVLCRQNERCFWMTSFFGFYAEEATKNHFICSNGFAYKYCIPYKGNEHLLGTNNDCDEYYKTWE